MKYYLIMQRSTEYNDEYDVVQEHGGQIYKNLAFSTRAAAEAKLAEAIVEAASGKSLEYDVDIKDMAYIQEIELDESSQSYQDRLKEIEIQKAEANACARELLSNELAVIMQECGLSEVRWRQFTPYFNDGDECVFHVYADFEREHDIVPGQPNVNAYRYTCLHNNQPGHDKIYNVWLKYIGSGFDLHFEYGPNGGNLVGGIKGHFTLYNDAEKAYNSLIQEKLGKGYHKVEMPSSRLSKLIGSINEEDFKKMFGDHVEVVAKLEDGKVNFEIEDCAHD